MEGNLQGAEHCGGQERMKTTNSDMQQSVSQLSRDSGTKANVMAAVWPHVAACAASLDEVSSAIYCTLFHSVDAPSTPA